MRLRLAISLGVVAIVGALLCLAGFVIAESADDRISGYPAIHAGGSDDLELEAGAQIGWYEAGCFGCKGRESIFVAPRLSIEGAAVTPYGDGREARYAEDRFLNYSDGDREGGPAYEIEVPAAGTYRVTLGLGSEPAALVRIGPSTETRKIAGIVIAIAGFLIAGGAVIVLGAWWISVMLKQATEGG